MKEQNLRTFYSILMSILLGMLGTLVWLLIFYFKIVTGYVSLLIFALTYIGYKCVSKKHIFKFLDFLIVFIIALIETGVVFLLSYSTFTMELLNTNEVSYNVITAIGQFNNVANINATFKSQIILDGGLALGGVVLGLIVIFIIEYNLLKKQKLAELQNQTYKINFADFGVNDKKHKKQKEQKPIDVTKDIKLKTKKVKKVKNQTEITEVNAIVINEHKYDKIKNLLDKNKQ